MNELRKYIDILDESRILAESNYWSNNELVDSVMAYVSPRFEQNNLTPFSGDMFDYEQEDPDPYDDEDEWYNENEEDEDDWDYDEDQN